jgi:hypothetical protein
MSKRCPQYLQGRREAIKWAITWLHARAEQMNDPHAKAILNVAGTEMGFDTRNGEIPKIKRKSLDRFWEFTGQTPPQS